MKISNKTDGVALIEVLIAFVIVAVSLSALYKLINIYLRDEINASAHLGALYLAEGKLDDLRTFGSLTVSSGVPAYDTIASNVGGVIPSGTVSSGNYTYALNWDVSAAANNASKTVIIRVSGTNSTENVLLFGSIPRIATVSTARIASGSTSTAISPNITYTPGSTPNVVAIDLGNGSKQETTKPLPTVSNSGGSVQVKFSTVTYNSLNNTQILSDFETLSCSCTNNGGSNVSSLLPATPELLSAGIYWNLGSSASKPTAVVADNQQPTLCNICCQNHYDGLTTTGGDFTNYYNQLNQAALKYSYNGSYTQVGTGTFIDSCRLLRINGYYKPMPDWNLVKLAVMNESFLTDSNNVAKYQAYVSYVVTTYINNQKNNSTTAISDFSTWLNTTYGINTNITTTTTSTPTQLIARGIFVDNLDKNSTLFSSIHTDQPGYLAKVPFYDINMTLLSRWTTIPSAGVATVADDTIKTLSATNSDYYGVYRRGYVTPVSSGVATITASAYQGDSSIAAYQYNKNALEAAISPFERDNANNGSVLFTVSGSSGTGAVAITGKIYCYDVSTNGKNSSLTDCVQGNTNLLSSIAVQGSGASCQTEASGLTGSNKYAYILYTCTVPSLPTSASVAISAVPSGFVATPSSLLLDPSGATTTPITGGCFNVYNSSVSAASLTIPACTP